MKKVECDPTRERKEYEIAETGRILGVDRAVFHINYSQAKKKISNWKSSWEV